MNKTEASTMFVDLFFILIHLLLSIWMPTKEELDDEGYVVHKKPRETDEPTIESWLMDYVG